MSEIDIPIRRYPECIAMLPPSVMALFNVMEPEEMKIWVSGQANEKSNRGALGLDTSMKLTSIKLMKI